MPQPTLLRRQGATAFFQSHASGAPGKTSRAKGVRALILNSMSRFAATLTLAVASALAAALAPAALAALAAPAAFGGKRG